MNRSARVVLGISWYIFYIHALGRLFIPSNRFEFLIVGFLLVFNTAIISGLLLENSILDYGLGLTRGKSMYPTIPPGLSFVVEKTPTDVSVGDVVVVRISSEKVLHRVVEKTEDGFILQGDNNAVPDNEVIQEQNVLAKAMVVGNQPVYIPISILSILLTLVKISWWVRRDRKTVVSQVIAFVRP